MEQWKPVVGFEDGYEVSSLGRIRSIDREKFISGKKGSYTRVYKGKMLTPTFTSNYILISLTHGTRFLVHQLVAKAFIPNPEGKSFVNHIDGNKHNNRVDNLEWVTSSENRYHALEIGLVAKGEERKGSKLTEDDVRWIRENAKSNGGTLSHMEMSKILGVSKTLCGYVARREIWKHVTDKGNTTEIYRRNA